MTDFEPFDLKRAEAGEPVMFRGVNKDIRFVSTLRAANGEVWRVIFAEKLHDDNEGEVIRRPDGIRYDNRLSEYDIVMKPKPPITKKYWVGLELYGDGNVRKSWVAPFPPIVKWQHVIEIEVTLPPTKR